MPHIPARKVNPGKPPVFFCNDGAEAERCEGDSTVGYMAKTCLAQTLSLSHPALSSEIRSANCLHLTEVDGAN
jgi:hypothetical protein